MPRYYVQEPDARPLRWTTHEPRDAESTKRWLDLVYSPTTLITGLAVRVVDGDNLAFPIEMIGLHSGQAVISVPRTRQQSCSIKPGQLCCRVREL